MELVTVWKINPASGWEVHLERSDIPLFIVVSGPFHVTCCCLRASQVQVCHSHLPKVSQLEATIAKGESGLSFRLSDSRATVGARKIQTRNRRWLRALG